MRLDAITPLILTYNEIANIARVLDRLSWASQIVVIDSGSTDGTLELLRSMSQVKVITRPFDSFASQCNFGLAQISTEWVLSLDADYVCSAELAAELSNLPERSSVNGYAVSFRYAISGKVLRGTLYPPRTVLFRGAVSRYVDDGHAHRVVVDGELGTLQSLIVHDDRKPLDAWLRAQDRYAREEARKLRTLPRAELGKADRVRQKVWVAPLLMPAYCLIGRGLILDGLPGVHYALQRTYAEILLSLRLLAE